jgi:hypothetical protein
VLGVLDVAEPELMSVLVPEDPVVEPLVEPAVPEAPIDVPLPVLVPAEPAVVSVLLEVEPVPDMLPPAVLPVVLLGDVVVDGVLLEVVEPVPASSRLPQADSESAAMRARAAHCAIGDLIIRNSLWVWYRIR